MHFAGDRGAIFQTTLNQFLWTFFGSLNMRWPTGCWMFVAAGIALVLIVTPVRNGKELGSESLKEIWGGDGNCEYDYWLGFSCGTCFMASGQTDLWVKCLQDGTIGTVCMSFTDSTSCATHEYNCTGAARFYSDGECSVDAGATICRTEIATTSVLPIDPSLCY